MFRYSYSFHAHDFVYPSQDCAVALLSLLVVGATEHPFPPKQLLPGKYTLATSEIFRYFSKQRINFLARSG